MEAVSGVDSIRRDFELFKLEMQRKDSLKRQQSDRRDIEKRAAKLKRQKDSRHQLQRAAEYLSLRSIAPSLVDVGASHLANATLTKPESKQPQRSPPTLFVCVDVEAFEHDQS